MTETSVRLYEMLYIIDATLQEAEIKAVEEDIKKTITASGGNVTKENIWGKRQLAYPIKKKTQGFYVDLEFESTSAAPAELREYFHTHTNVLRNMIMQVPKAKLIQEKRDADRLKRQKEKAEKERLAAKAAEEAAAQKALEEEVHAAAAEPDPAEAPTPAPVAEAASQEAPASTPAADPETVPAPAAEAASQEAPASTPAAEPEPEPAPAAVEATPATDAHAEEPKTGE